MLDRLRNIFGIKRRSLEAGAVGRRWADARTIDNINSSIAAGGRTATRRASYYVTNNSWAASAVASLVANIIGAGIVPRSEHPSPKVREALGKLWLRWTDEADASGLLDLYGLQAAVTRSMIEKGEAFVRFRARQPLDGLSVPLQLELIDPEQVPMDLSRDLGNGGRIRNGIEFDALNRRVAFHVYRHRPGDGLFGSSLETVRVPATEMLHVFKPIEPGQVRGLSWLAPVMLRLHDLDGYEDAALLKAKIQNMLTAFITTTAEKTHPLIGGATSTTTAGTSDFAMQPGAILDLDQDEDVRFTDPPVNRDYSDFTKNQLRAISAGMGVMYEQLSGDYAGVTFSSIRAGLIEHRRRIEQIQHGIVVFQLCRPIWNRWIELAALSGAVRIGRDLAPYRAVKWLPPKFEHADPWKDQQTEISAIEAGLMSRSHAIAERGYDAETVDSEIAADHARAAKLGLAIGGKIITDKDADDA